MKTTVADLQKSADKASAQITATAPFTVAEFRERIAAVLGAPGSTPAKSRHPSTVRTPSDLGYYKPTDPREITKRAQLREENQKCTKTK